MDITYRFTPEPLENIETVRERIASFWTEYGDERPAATGNLSQMEPIVLDVAINAGSYWQNLPPRNVEPKDRQLIIGRQDAASREALGLYLQIFHHLNGMDRMDGVSIDAANRRFAAYRADRIAMIGTPLARTYRQG